MRFAETGRAETCCSTIYWRSDERTEFRITKYATQVCVAKRINKWYYWCLHAEIMPMSVSCVTRVSWVFSLSYYCASIDIFQQRYRFASRFMCHSVDMNSYLSSCIQYSQMDCQNCNQYFATCSAFSIPDECIELEFVFRFLRRISKQKKKMFELLAGFVSCKLQTLVLECASFTDHVWFWFGLNFFKWIIVHSRWIGNCGIERVSCRFLTDVDDELCLDLNTV